MKIWIINGEEYTDIDEAAQYISDNIDEGAYDDMLDDAYGEIDICGYSYAASIALYRVDPTAYRVGFGDYSASMFDDVVYELDNMTSGETSSVFGTDVECVDPEEDDEDVYSSRSLKGRRPVRANAASRRSHIKTVSAGRSVPRKPARTQRKNKGEFL